MLARWIENLGGTDIGGFRIALNGLICELDILHSDAMGHLD